MKARPLVAYSLDAYVGTKTVITSSPEPKEPEVKERI